MLFPPKLTMNKKLLIFSQNRHSLFLLLFFMAATSTFAQTITGKVTDVDNNPLIGAYIIAPEQTGVGAIVDENGDFSVKVNKLPVTLKFSYSGYKDETVEVTSVKKLNIKLESTDNVLTAAVVKASRVSEKQKETPLTVPATDTYQ